MDQVSGLVSTGHCRSTGEREAFSSTRHIPLLPSRASERVLLGRTRKVTSQETASGKRPLASAVVVRDAVELERGSLLDERASASIELLPDPLR